MINTGIYNLWRYSVHVAVSAALEIKATVVIKGEGVGGVEGGGQTFRIKITPLPHPPHAHTPLCQSDRQLRWLGGRKLIMSWTLATVSAADGGQMKWCSLCFTFVSPHDKQETVAKTGAAGRKWMTCMRKLPLVAHMVQQTSNRVLTPTRLGRWYKGET